MAQSTAKLQEPSMEEILASIRRIISDDAPVAEVVKAPVSLAEVKPEPDEVAPQLEPEPAPAITEVVAEPAQREVMTQDAVDALLSGPEGQDAGVLDLTEAVETPTPAAMRAIEAGDVVFRDQEEPLAQEAEESRQIAKPAPPREEEGLMSEQATAAVSAAFDSLANTFFSQNARTIEDLVREMLRPMLRHWLDDNLPSVVERLVRAEIERVSRGGR
jgi:cell pole-organizing protein PopZ